MYLYGSVSSTNSDFAAFWRSRHNGMSPHNSSHFRTNRTGVCHQIQYRRAHSRGALAPNLHPPAETGRKPVPRKGHTKSCNGCYNCKRRKVKRTGDVAVCLHFNCISLVSSIRPYPSSSAHTHTLDGSASRSVGSLVARSPSPPNVFTTIPTSFCMDDRYAGSVISGVPVYGEDMGLPESARKRRPPRQAGAYQNGPFELRAASWAETKSPVAKMASHHVLKNSNSSKG
ncbi:hypothetical protein SODALDRAFT_380580 [Sodiomyces alkalinus F11]|uniref:Zn(2)-C6 fungal-type domain-containing protein n=1 Tax=Sodiomyces alkalinus (strain CBS 110278 / VKM F-3762 / F11) TaxID=1314773 RepID=A0A3N2PP05_SODAK|nr:hypothetical protein SODALDRAFT_380580 [Sodiomyces alkalinus F11]ROT36245.1 hypothetical protein SODALDRAFT_380580 [Sodiomyces alkalinus F11]